jgi:hypothetical protein
MKRGRTANCDVVGGGNPVLLIRRHPLLDEIVL